MPETSNEKHPLLEALLLLGKIFDGDKISYAVTGGLAASYHGSQRATQDIDFLIAVDKIKISSFLNILRLKGFNFDESETLKSLNQDGLARVYYKKYPVDFLMPVIAFFNEVIKRAQSKDFYGAKLRFATPEDLILLKLIAFRPKDQEDIKSILAAQDPRSIDKQHIFDWLRKLSQPEDGKEAWIKDWMQKLSC